jgi:hypothetical protein
MLALHYNGTEFTASEKRLVSAGRSFSLPLLASERALHNLANRVRGLFVSPQNTIHLLGDG